MIYLIITACLNNKYGKKDPEHREKWYIQSITKALGYSKNLPIKPIIVENNGKRETFLDMFSSSADVVYTDNNAIPTKNKAQNELLDIKEIIEKYNIQDNDMIIKLTGRYTMISAVFFSLVMNGNFDAFLKFFNVCSRKPCKNDCLLGLYAIKAKYLKEFQYEFKKSPEVEFATYVRQNIPSLREIQHLMLFYCLAENFNEILV
jgi:hypothetical protein